MAALVVELLKKKKVAVISGSSLATFEQSFLNPLPHSSANFNNLFLLPTSGTQLMVWRGSWRQVYSEPLTQIEKDEIRTALDSALKIAGYVKPAKIYGDLIEDRGSQITFSANGQHAPLEIKTAWDPTGERRQNIIAILKKKLPRFDIGIGGTNSIDITHKGVNKAYGIRKLEHFLKLGPDAIAFVGDKLMLGGNDYPARATGVDCIQVKGPEETKELIRSWLA